MKTFPKKAQEAEKAKAAAPALPQYHLLFEEGNKYAVGVSTTPSAGSVPAPEGFDPQINEVRRDSDNTLVLVSIEEREAYELARREALFSKKKPKSFLSIFGL